MFREQAEERERIFREETEERERIFRKELDRIEAKVDKAKLETKASRADSRLLNLSGARNLITMILYDHCGFETSHAGSPDTFRLTFEGKASSQSRKVPDAQRKITELAMFYHRAIDSTNDLISVVCRWDQIKGARNKDQHGLDLSAKLTEMIAFYDRHIALGDELDPENLEFYNFFRAVQEFKNLGSTFPVSTADSTPITAGHMPIGGGTVRISCSYAQALAKKA